MRRAGLTRRTVLASALLALLIAGVFVVLLVENLDQRDARGLARHSRTELTDAQRLLTAMVNLETGLRGFVITREERFLEPWQAARAAFPSEARALARFADDPAQAARARRMADGAVSYIQDYSIPLVDAVRRNEPSTRSLAVTDEGKRRVDALRTQFARFTAIESATVATQQKRVDNAAQRALVAGAAGLGLSIVLIGGFGAFLVRQVVLPIRRAAAMAGRLAGGDLAVRMPQTGTGEIGELQRAFNVMGSSLEASRDGLRQLADEQAALRRVATLVARAVPSSELLEAVTDEVGRLLGADSTRLLRYESDGTVTKVVGAPGAGPPDGARFTLDGDSVSAAVLRTGRPARMDSYEGATGPVATMVYGQGIRCAVGAPIVVEDRVWGVIVAAWTDDRGLSPDLEGRMAEFTELVATAIANASSRAELAASRARVVTTADETRRRLERDLHDGAQQRLTHTVITLKLARRALGKDDGPAVELVNEALDQAERATGELRELAHGILPAILNRGGLRAGVETLVSRVRLPVAVDVTEQRLPRALEATAYFIVAEALTNVVKHASAAGAQITAIVDGAELRLEVRDDGVGGALIDHSSGLLGLQDRAAAMDGELRVDSPVGGGTVVAATLPIRAG